jgi:hypothetical protein
MQTNPFDANKFVIFFTNYGSQALSIAASGSGSAKR